MKLPADRTERIKILILIAVGSIAVVFMFVTLLVKPLLSHKTERREEIAKLAVQLSAAEADVGRMLTERDSNIRTLEKIVDIANRQGYMLEPRLGNYELGAHEYVDSVAQEAGITVTTVQELGITLLPQPPESKIEHALKCYNLHVTVHASLHAVHRLLSVLESRNPYVVVSGIAVSTRPEDPVEHEVALDLQFPIWSDPMRSQQLEKRLQECLIATQAAPAPAPVPAPGG